MPGTEDAKGNHVSNPADGSGIGKLLADSLKALGDYHNAADNPDEEPAPVVGNGSGGDGMVTATAKVPGEVSVAMDPRVLRMDSTTLAEHTTEAVNAALSDLRDKAAKVSGAADLGDLNEKLTEIQDRALPELKSFMNHLNQAQEQLAERGRR